MGAVTALGYVRINAPDIESWRTYGTDLLGLQVAEGGAASIGDGALYLKQDDRSYRIAVHQGDPGPTTFGWEVANRAALDEVAATLDAAGYPVSHASTEHSQSRLTAGMLLGTDPAGNKCEFYYGASCDKQAFVSPNGSRFTTGDMGLGHAFVIVPDAKAFEAYYSLLGFKVSDYIPLMGGLLGTFMHCNARHHSLAFIEVPEVSMLQHLMVEVDDMDAVGRGYDKCLGGAAPILMTLGKHTNDQMFSFYSRSPSGVAVELGTGGVRVDDESWTVQTFTAASYWGHAHQQPAAPR